MQRSPLTDRRGGPSSSIGSAMSGGATPITLSPGAAMLSFTIEHTSLGRDARGNVYTAYRVVTLLQGQEWAVSKRFNDFRALHELMKVHLPELPSNFPLWPNIFNRFDPAVILSRNPSLDSDAGASARTNSVDSHSFATLKYQNGITAQYIHSGASGCADHAMKTTP